LIKLVNLQREFLEIREEVMRAIEGVCESGSFILGENVEAFEREFCEYIGCRFGCGVNSGTDALRIALEACGVGEGDEVVTVSHTFIATADAIRMVRAKPVFVDIDQKTYNMDVSKLERAINKKTKAVIPVHIYGQPAALDEIREICDKHSLLLIQDACQAHGALYKGKKLGEYGDVLCYSFYPSKDLGAYGDAGLIATNLDEVAERTKMLRNYGQSKKYHHDFLGYNSRLDELQAAVLRVKLKKLEHWIEKRRQAAKRYNELLSEVVLTPFENPLARHVYYLYVIQTQNRDRIREQLLKHGIETGVHYPVPVHLQKSYQDFRVSLPVTEQVSQRILSLPLDPFITEEEQERVCYSLRKMLLTTTYEGYN
jgi:dTDP-4-amino-4,6-dideoxygalactose transaminase